RGTSARDGWRCRGSSASATSSTEPLRVGRIRAGCGRLRIAALHLLWYGPVSARGPERSRVMAGGKTFKRDQKRRKEMARKLKQEEKMRKRLARKDEKKTIDDLVEEPTDGQPVE